MKTVNHSHSWSRLGDALNQNLPAGGQTALELSRLANRLEDPTYCLTWITIAVHGNSRHLIDLRDGVAAAGWVIRYPIEWPDIIIDGRQKEGIRSRMDGHPSQEIRMFYLWPAIRRKVESRKESAWIAAVRVGWGCQDQQDPSRRSYEVRGIARNCSFHLYRLPKARFWNKKRPRGEKFQLWSFGTKMVYVFKSYLAFTSFVASKVLLPLRLFTFHHQQSTPFWRNMDVAWKGEYSLQVDIANLYQNNIARRQITGNEYIQCLLGRRIDHSKATCFLARTIGCPWRLLVSQRDSI